MAEAPVYGRFRRSRASLQVAARADVRMRLRRWFNMPDSASETLTLSDTPGHCRDLWFFLQRYPMEGSADDLAYVEQRSDGIDARETRFREIAAGERVPEPVGLRIPLRDYQKIPAAIALETGGLLVADDLGLGKTAEGIALFADPRARPGLLVCPTHLQMQWSREINRFAPRLRAHIIEQTQPYSLRSGRGGRVPNPDVLICTYAKLWGWVDAFRRYGLKSVVWEEAHELRRRKSRKYTAAWEIRQMVAYAMGLTATPVYNGGDEVHNIMECIQPGALGSLDEFVRNWLGGRGYAVDPVALGTALRDQGLFIRRTKKEVGRELPALQRIPQAIGSDTSALNEMQGTARDLALFVLERGAAQLSREEHQALTLAQNQLLNVLRQMTGIAKAPHVADLVRMIVEGEGRKVVLTGWHRAVYEIWMERLRDLRPVMYTGSESPRQKDEARAAFVDGDAQILIISNRSGAGLDGLQRVCSTIVHGELDWSPKVHEQLDGRVHRDQQTEPVQAFYPVADIGSDPVIAEILGVKEVQARGVVNLDGPGGFDLSEVSEKAARERFRMLAESYLEQQGVKVPKRPRADAAPGDVPRRDREASARPQHRERREQLDLLGSASAAPAR